MHIPGTHNVMHKKIMNIIIFLSIKAIATTTAAIVSDRSPIAMYDY